MPYVTLRRVKNIRIRGELKIYQPGDAVKVGKQTALEWVLDGSAEDPFGQVGPPLLQADIQERGSEYGIRVRGPASFAGVAPLGEVIRQMSFGLPALPYKYTLIWRPDMETDPRMVRYGFMRVQEIEGEDTWELAASLVSTSLLANSLGSEEEQKKTFDAIGDLRLPVYESRLVWARRTPDTLKFVAAWAMELENSGDEYHSFLRALYTNPTWVCTIPGGWRG